MTDDLTAKRAERNLRASLLRIYHEALAKDDGTRMPRSWVRPGHMTRADCRPQDAPSMETS